MERTNIQNKTIPLTLDHLLFSKSTFWFPLRLLTFPHANKSVIAYDQRIKITLRSTFISGY